MEYTYKDDIKRLLLIYKYNVDHREEYYDKIFARNKNKLVLALLDLFDEEITNFKYDDEENDITYLFTLMDILPDALKHNKFLQQTAINRFTDIHRNINETIHVRPKEMNKNQTNRYKLLKNILFKMEDTILKFSYEIPADYEPTKEEFISYILFKSKNINHFTNAIDKFPYIVNIKDNNDAPLINRVIEKYLEALDTYLADTNLGPIDDLIYYKRIIYIILHSPKIALNEEDKEELINILNSHLKGKTYDVIRQKEKHEFFINTIIMELMGIEDEYNIVNLNYEYEVHEEFKATHVLEAKKIYILNKDIEKPTKNRYIYTFDGDHAYELDDALSIEKQDGIYKLGVHIANPYAYIKPSSILYDEAKKRTRSLYSGTECIPMYPFNLSADLMSLNEGKVRYAMSHYFDIDESTGEMIDYNIKAEPIIVTKNLTYNKFNEDISHGSDDEEYYETLLNLCEVAPILGQVYDEDSVYREYHSDNSRTIATSVVEKCMIYTNYNLAKLFSQKELPYIYRCHKVDEKVTKEIEDLQSRIKLRSNDEDVLRDLEMLKNIFPRAYYTLNNVGHEGLGTSYYSHVTSPLRRFADNVATECIYKFILGEYTQDDIKAYQEYIEAISEQINQKRRSLDNYEIERVHIKNK